jgi:uncharacterized protein YjiS (DUF1127 family)
MSKPPPPTKKELDELNAQINKLRAPKPPHMAPAPGGSMRRQATQVQNAETRKHLQKLEDRADKLRDALGEPKPKAQRNSQSKPEPKADFNRASGARPHDRER